MRRRLYETLHYQTQEKNYIIFVRIEIQESGDPGLMDIIVQVVSKPKIYNTSRVILEVYPKVMYYKNNKISKMLPLSSTIIIS